MIKVFIIILSLFFITCTVYENKECSLESAKKSLYKNIDSTQYNIEIIEETKENWKFKIIAKDSIKHKKYIESITKKYHYFIFEDIFYIDKKKCVKEKNFLEIENEKWSY